MLEKNFIYIICGREIDERFNETWYGSSNPVSFKIIKKQKQKNYVTNLCVLHQIAKSNYLLWWRKNLILNQATKSAIYFMPV